MLFSSIRPEKKNQTNVERRNSRFFKLLFFFFTPLPTFFLFLFGRVGRIPYREKKCLYILIQDTFEKWHTSPYFSTLQRLSNITFELDREMANLNYYTLEVRL